MGDKTSGRMAIVDLWKFIAAVMIMVHHLYEVAPVFENRDYPGYFSWIYVEFFFILTGYFTYRRFARKDRREDVFRSTLSYTWQKFKPFLPYTTIAITLQYLLSAPYGELIRGSFISNVLRRAIPNGVSAVIALSAGIICGHTLGFTVEQLSTVSAFILASVSFIIVLLACHPMRPWKIGMLVLLIGAFLCGHIFLEEFFGFVPFTPDMILTTAIITAIAVVLTIVLNIITVAIADRITEKRRNKV